MFRRSALAVGSALALLLASGASFGQTGKVTVVTSFSKDVTDPIKKAFEKAVPGAMLEVQNRNTNAGVKFIEETKGNNQVDLFWASAPDAFEVLKGKKLLSAYKPKASGIAEKVGSYPVNDKDGFYSGFAASGYGIMWNERYVKANKLPTPKDWQDLAQAPYFDHVSISAPSRSGTTHLTIETILQGEGWDKGWRTTKEIAGNLRTVTDRSFGVPEAVNSGQVGYGIVIDFFAFSSQGAGFPVKFVCPNSIPNSCSRAISASSPTRRTRPARRPSSNSCCRPKARKCCSSRRSAACRCARRPTPRPRPTIPIPSRTRTCRGC